MSATNMLKTDERLVSDMELRHLRYFVAVAEELSFTRAAEKLRIAQPSLTRQIKDLEEEIGARLLDRTKKQVKLTNEGECLLARAKRLLGDSIEMVESVREVSRQAASIRIGYLPHPFHRLLPISISTFEQQYPKVSVKLVAEAGVGLVAAGGAKALADIFLGRVGGTPARIGAAPIPRRWQRVDPPARSTPRRRR